MKIENISFAINEIEDEIINSANEIRTPKKRKSSWVKFAGTVAAVAVVAFIGIGVLGESYSLPRPPKEPLPSESEPSAEEFEVKLPKLVYEESQGFAMGFEGYLAYEIDELENKNPWSESIIFETMPVYKNTAFHETGIPNGGLSEEEILAKIYEITGENHDQFEYTYAGDFTSGSGIPDEMIYSIETTYNNMKITAEPTGTVTVNFNANKIHDGVSLPEEYNLRFDGNYEDSIKALEYIYNNNRDVIKIESPTFVYSKDYTFSGEISANFSIYDFSGDELSDILNFSFNRIQIAPNDEGKLMLVRIYDGLAAAEKIGDYPIVTSDEAREILIDGGYITSAPYEMPGEEYIARVELIYRSGSTENIFMPYYRFLVEVPELEQENGLKNFCAYYVPAVESEYLEGYPIWDGRFN